MWWPADSYNEVHYGNGAEVILAKVYFNRKGQVIPKVEMEWLFFNTRKLVYLFIREYIVMEHSNTKWIHFPIILISANYIAKGLSWTTIWRHCSICISSCVCYRKTTSTVKIFSTEISSNLTNLNPSKR